MKFPFTEAKLAKLTCPPSGDEKKRGEVWAHDSKTTGLAYRVSEGGGRSFYWYRRIPGRPSPLKRKLDQDSLVTARQEVDRCNGTVAKGEVPVTTREALVEEQRAEAVAPTLEDLWESYRDHHLANCKERTIAEFTRLYVMFLSPWADRALKDISGGECEVLKNDIGKKSHVNANRTLAVLCAMFRRRGHLFGLPRGYSPTAGLDHYEEKARDRVLSVQELAKVLQAIDADENPTARDVLKVLIYTGQRRNTVVRMAWQDLNIEGGTWRIPGAKTKNGKPLVLSLIPAALEILKTRYDTNPLDNPWVFPAHLISAGAVERARQLQGVGVTTRDIAIDVKLSQSSVVRILEPTFAARPMSPFGGIRKAWIRVLKRAGVPHASIHDIRRTFCTNLLEAGVPLPIVASAMGHADVKTTARHYAFASDKAVATATSMAALMGAIDKINAPKKAVAKPAA